MSFTLVLEKSYTVPKPVRSTFTIRHEKFSAEIQPIAGCEPFGRIRSASKGIIAIGRGGTRHLAR